MSKGISSSSRFSRCLKAPVRLLGSIRDKYVRGMTSCAGKVGQYHGGGVAYPSFSDFAYSDSFSSSSRRSDDIDDEDLRELIRSLSRERYADRGARPADHVRRSQSVVVGRIDEDQPCEFKEEVTVGSSLIFPRSSSHAGVGVGIKKKRGHKANLFA